MCMYICMYAKELRYVTLKMKYLVTHLKHWHKHPILKRKTNHFLWNFFFQVFCYWYFILNYILNYTDVQCKWLKRRQVSYKPVLCRDTVERPSWTLTLQCALIILPCVYWKICSTKVIFFNSSTRVTKIFVGSLCNLYSQQLCPVNVSFKWSYYELLLDHTVWLWVLRSINAV